MFRKCFSVCLKRTEAAKAEEWDVNPGTPKEYQLTNEDPDLWDLEQANLLF